MSCETITIPKDEYIDLLRSKSSLKEKELASTDATSLPPRKPHSWMNQAEKSEILRLASLGYRLGEIGQKVGRPIATVGRYLRESRRLAGNN